jgi:hypothetical protein
VLQLLVVLKQQVEGKLIKEQSGLIPASRKGLEVALQGSNRVSTKAAIQETWLHLGHPSTHRLTPQVDLPSERLSWQGTSLCRKKQTSRPKHNLQRPQQHCMSSAALHSLGTPYLGTPTHF